MEFFDSEVHKTRATSMSQSTVLLLGPENIDYLYIHPHTYHLYMCTCKHLHIYKVIYGYTHTEEYCSVYHYIYHFTRSPFFYITIDKYILTILQTLTDVSFFNNYKN